MKRREFIGLLGGAAAAWPVEARAQQEAMPVIGYLHRETLTPSREVLIAAMKRGVAEVGYFEGRNVAMEYRWAEGRTDRLPALATDLVRRNVAVIVAVGNTPTALAAKSATQTIPIAFLVGTDPVESGLVESLNRPGGNATGVSIIDVEVIAKRIELLQQLLPAATSIALFVNPKNPITTRAETREAQVAAQALGLRLLVSEASSANEIGVAFDTLVRQQASAILVSSEIFFFTVQDQLIDLAMRHKVPISIPQPEGVRKGALIGYGANTNDAHRTLGVFAGRLLKGERAADMPVQRSVKINLLINLKTARALGIDVPPTLLARADEVIE
jgi:putative tryptophan/tyrosine transport system substrate-binding protein